MMWPFKWKLSACTFTWSYLFVKILKHEIWKFGQHLPLATFASERVKEWWDKINVMWFLKGQTRETICPCKKSRSSLFSLDNRKWEFFMLKMIMANNNGWKWSLLLNSLDAVATADVLTANNNDLNIDETRTIHFAWLFKNHRLVLKEQPNSTAITHVGKLNHLFAGWNTTWYCLYSIDTKGHAKMADIVNKVYQREKAPPRNEKKEWQWERGCSPKLLPRVLSHSSLRERVKDNAGNEAVCSSCLIINRLLGVWRAFPY